MPANSGGVDCVRFFVDEFGDLKMLCHCLKQSGPDSAAALSWGAACNIVRSMRRWLAVAAWLASSTDQGRVGRSMPRRQRTKLWAALDEPYDSVAEGLAVSDDPDLDAGEPASKRRGRLPAAASAAATAVASAAAPAAVGRGQQAAAATTAA